MLMCIWCRQSVECASVEHIVPEALGLIPELVLDQGQVCRSCNSRLGYLDRAVVDEFEILKFMAAVPGKRGKSPVIESVSNLVGRYVDGQPSLAVNLDPKPVEAMGKRLGSANSNRRRVSGSTQGLPGGRGQINLQQDGLCNSKLCVRGLHKIAFAFLAWCGHYDDVASGMYERVRRFIVDGLGDRRVILLATGESVYRVVAGPLHFCDEDEPVFKLEVAGACFLIDLTSDQRCVPELMQELRRQHGETDWTWVPL